ncbi:MAG TPA: hypothetical protein VG142_08025 [Trebonia sp.]|nr:hypothetical protein [Trebonia sp.]
MTSLAVGILESDGALSLDDPVLAHLPELADIAAAGSAGSSTRSPGWTCATSWFPGCSTRSASAIPSGCAARSASLSAQSAFSCGPRKSPGSRNCCCTKAPAAPIAWSRAATSPA